LVNKCSKREKGFLRVKEIASWLDSYYIPLYHPNGLDTEITPVDYYEKEDAQRSIKVCNIDIERGRYPK